jgi:hypothetical protein
VVAYRHPELVTRFCDNWNVERRQSTAIFDDLKRYLWLTVKTDEPVAPVAIVDEMWHMFLVFTEDYAAFCKTYFGAMLHHVPTSSREKKALDKQFRTQTDKWRAEMGERLRRDMTLVFDLLGEDVMRRWYVDYPERYGRDFFAHEHLVSCTAYRFPPSLKRGD